MNCTLGLESWYVCIKMFNRMFIKNFVLFQGFSVFCHPSLARTAGRYICTREKVCGGLVKTLLFKNTPPYLGQFRRRREREAIWFFILPGVQIEVGTECDKKLLCVGRKVKGLGVCRPPPLSKVSVYLPYYRLTCQLLISKHFKNKSTLRKARQI